MENIVQAIQKRRSVYALKNSIPISEEALVSALQEILAAAPSAFNSQGERLVLLIGEQSSALWEIVTKTLREIVPEENWKRTENRLKSFAAGYGTILFFEDTATTNSYMEEYPLYKEAFPVWACESGGMLQFAVWTALANLGIGANLQHYNPLIDEKVRETFSLPESWKLLAQMPFGAPLALPGEKEKLPISERMRILK